MVKTKKNTMLITSPRELIELINHNTYIFNKKIKKLSLKTKLTGMAFICCGIYIIVSYRNLEEETYKLSIRVKKLENKTEGE